MCGFQSPGDLASTSIQGIDGQFGISCVEGNESIFVSAEIIV